MFQSIENWNSLTATADFLTEEQVSAIQKYFSSFSPEESDKTKLRFINLWKAMPAIYKSLNDNLKAMNLLYEGALCRDVVENHLDKIDKDKTYVFVGFNVLTKVQEKLLQQIHDQGKALFYWDYDDRLNEKSEGLARLMYDASHFIRHYEKRMPNALSFDNEEVGDVSVNFIKTDSFNAQARYLPHWLDDNVQKGDLTNTVVILSDESMLPQVLGTLPEEAVNITMGYKSDYESYAIAGTLDHAYVGGIAGVNHGDVYGVKVIVQDSAGFASCDGYVGGIVGLNGATGTIGVTSSATVLWHASLSDVAYFGGIAADNRGTMQSLTVAVNIEDEKVMPTLTIAASACLGGVVGANGGSVNTATVDVGDNVYLGSSKASDSYVGGLIGQNTGDANRPSVTIRGYLGNDKSYYVGGFAGYTSGTISNGYVVNYHDLGGTPTARKGVAVGATAEETDDGDPVVYGVNAWAVAFNSVRLAASTSAASGFNVLKVVAGEMVTASISASE